MATILVGIASAQDDTPITTDLTLAQTLTGHDLPVNDLAFTPDGNLISASDDITSRLWDIETGDTIWTLDGQLIQVRSVDVSPDGNTALTTGFNSSAFLWDIRSRTRGRGVEALAAFNDGEFAPDGETFALAVGDGTVRIYDFDGEEPLLTVEADALLVPRISYNPDGTRIAAGHGFPSDNVLVWDAASGETLLTLSGHDGTVNGVDYAPDGDRLLSGGGDGQLIMWDAETGDTLYTIANAHDGEVFDVAFSPTGDLFASVGFDGVLRLWNAEDGTPLAEYQQAGSLLAVAFDSDGQRIAAGGEAAAVWVWQAP